MTVDPDSPRPHCPITVDHRTISRATKYEQERCLKRQHDELEALESIFPGQIDYLDTAEFVPHDTLSPPSHAFRVRLASLHSYARTSCVLDLLVVFGELYPIEPPRLSVKGGLANEAPLWEYIQGRQGEECMYDVCQLLLSTLDTSSKGGRDSAEDNLWDAYQRRQLCKEDELRREESKQKLALAADYARQKQRLAEDVEDLKDFNPILMASPKIPTLDFLPADPDCSPESADQISPFSLDATTPRVCPFPSIQRAHAASDPLDLARAETASPLSENRLMMAYGSRIRCVSATSPVSTHSGTKDLKKMTRTKKGRVSRIRREAGSDVSKRFKTSRGRSNGDDSDISRRYRSSSASEVYSDDYGSDFEIVEEEIGPAARSTIVLKESHGSSLQGHQVYSRYAEDYEQKHVLGEGAFGVVTKVRNLVDKQLYAVKRIYMPDSNAENSKVLQEVAMFPQLFHRHVVRYYHAWIERHAEHTYLFLQMEYCSGQSLLNAIESGHLHSDHELVWRLFRQIVDAVHYLHDHDILHRDLKPANIFLDRERSDAKVGDFGLSRYRKKQAEEDLAEDISPERNTHVPYDPRNTVEQRKDSLQMGSSVGEMSSEVGTAMYSAPEVSTGCYDHKSDMWSLGIVFFEMFHSPFNTRMERVSCILELPRKGPPADWGAPPNAVTILRRMVCPDPKERISAYELRVSELVPAVMQSADDDVAQRILMSLVNPMSAECGILLHAVSQRVESEAKTLAYTKGWLQPSSGNAAKRFISVCTTHRATNVELPLLRVQTESSPLQSIEPARQTSGDIPIEEAPAASARFGLLDLQCNTAVYLRTSLIDPFRKNSVCATEEHARRWHIGSVYSRKQHDAYGHPTALSAGILGIWDRKVPSNSDHKMFQANVNSSTKELLLATLEVLSGRRIELRICWPWLLSVLLGCEPSREWIRKDLRNRKTTKSNVTSYLNDIEKDSVQKRRYINSAVDLILGDPLDILPNIRSELPCVKEAMELVDLVTPFVDKLIVDPLCEGLDEENFEDFFFVCRSSVNRLVKPTVVSCKGGRISNESHVGSVAQFCLKKLDQPDNESTPRVLIAFHPDTPSGKRTSNHLMQVAALFWRQTMHCEILLNCSTEQEIRQEIQTMIKKNVQEKSTVSKAKSKGVMLGFVPVLVCVKLIENTLSYSCRAITFKLDVQKVTKVAIEREDVYDTKESLVKAVRTRYLHAKP